MVFVRFPSSPVLPEPLGSAFQADISVYVAGCSGEKGRGVGKLYKFISLVSEMVPDLLGYKHKTQLILGLRAQVSDCGYQNSLCASVAFLFIS